MTIRFVLREFDVFTTEFVPGEDPTPDQLAKFSTVKDVDYDKRGADSYIPLVCDFGS